LEQSLDSIDRSIIAFKYEGKAMASKCNNVIEAIFDSQILPEMDIAISKMIPKEIPIQLESLEIDIGTINEKELPTELAKRIKSALEDTLHNTLNDKFNGVLRNDLRSENKPHKYLLAALEYYLKKGYLPSWMKRESSIGQIIESLINTSQIELIVMLKKYSDNQSIMLRLSISLEPKVFESLVYAINRVNYQWILNLRNRLTSIENKKELSKFGSKGLSQLINSYILIYLLGMSSNSFNKVTFIKDVLSAYMSRFKVETKAILGAIKDINDSPEITQLMEKALQGIQKNEGSITNANNHLDVIRFIAEINKNDKVLSSQYSPLYRKQIIEIISDEKTRALLLDTLNDNGTLRILEQFYTKDVKELMSFMASFIREFKKTISSRSLKSFNSVQELALVSIFYLKDKLNQLINYNDFFLFLISILGANKEPILKSNSIKNYVNSQSLLNSSSLVKLLGDKEASKERTNIKESVLKGLGKKNDFKDEIHQKLKISSKTIDIYRKNIIQYYLGFGLLPKEFRSLNQIDVQNLFKELIQFKDSFLADKFRIDQSTQTFLIRIKFLVSDDTWEDLINYLRHYFSEAVTFLEDVIPELIEEFEKETPLSLNKSLFRKEFILKALLVSKGEHHPSLFVFLASRSLIESVNNSFKVSNHLKTHLLTRIEVFKTKDDYSKKHKNRALNLKVRSLIKSDILKLIRLLKGHVLVDTKSEQNQIRHINKLVHHLLAYPEDFQSVMFNTQLDSTEVITSFRMYLPEPIWKLFKKTMSSNIELKNNIIQIDKKVYNIVSSLKTPSFNLINELKNLKSKDTVRIKTILSLVLKEKTYFDEFYEVFKNNKFDLKEVVELKLFHKYLTTLMNFTPQSLSQDVSSEFWPKMILRFIIQLKIDEKHTLHRDFFKLLTRHIYREVKAIKKEEFYYKLLLELSDSNLKLNAVLFKSENDSDNDKLRTIIPLIADKKDIKSEFVNLDIENLKSNTYNHLSILAFYSHSGFFPWWTTTNSFTELMNKIFEKSQSLGKHFENIFLEIEEENKFIKPLVLKLPADLIAVLSLIFSRHSKLNSKWKKSLSVIKLKNDTSTTNTDPWINKDSSKLIVKSENFASRNFLEVELLQKAIYFMKDDEILKQWLKDDSEKKDQLLKYLKLAPFLYFQDISPDKWRSFVYTFAFDYYKLSQDRSKREFNNSFMNFLIRRNKNIPWKDVFNAIYKKTQDADSTFKNVFPNELLSFIGKETSNDKVLNMRAPENRNENNLIESGTEIRIYNSGLIILWPFLTRFFEQLALVKNGEFVNEQSRNRSVFLLQYLVYDGIDFQEYDLVLNKLFVGLPLENYLTPIAELTKDEKDLTISLLNGLMSNWDKVKNSSIDAIQETFLQREGILKFKKESITLVIEKKGVDVLLSSLSWNISLIKLPWMKKPIYVEWI